MPLTQRHPATNRQNELAIAHVVGKLAHLRWIRLRKHARNLHCRIFGRRAFRQRRGVAKGAALLYLHDQLRSNLTANGVRNCIHQAKFLNRFIVVNREHVRDTEGAGVIQFFRADTCNHLRAYLLRRMHCRTPNTAQRSRYQHNLSLFHVCRKAHKLVSREGNQRDRGRVRQATPSGRWVTSESSTFLRSRHETA
jgi:hypothetical protein